MLNSMCKKSLALFLVLSFLLLRVANAHTLSHFLDDLPEVECKDCEIIILTQKITPYSDNTLEKTQNTCPLIFIKDYFYIDYKEPFYDNTESYRFFNRPPPVW